METGSVLVGPAPVLMLAMGVSNLERAIEAIFPVNEMPYQPCAYRNADHSVGFLLLRTLKFVVVTLAEYRWRPLGGSCRGKEAYVQARCQKARLLVSNNLKWTGCVFPFACASRSAVTTSQHFGPIYSNVLSRYRVRCEVIAVAGSQSRFHASAPLTVPRICIRGRALILPFSNIAGLIFAPLRSSVALRLFCPASLLRHLLNHLPCFWPHPLYTQPSTVD